MMNMDTKAKPIRIQRKRTRGWKMPPNTVYVGRPSKWGNPYIVGAETEKINPINGQVIESRHKMTGEETIEKYRRNMETFHARTIKVELRGKNLACWCPLNQPCHADVLLEIANRNEETTK